MIRDDEKHEKRRIISRHITTVISITVVLLLIGIQGLFFVYAQKIGNYVKENIGFTISIKEFTKESDILDLKAILDSSKYVKSSEYITKDSAAAELQKDLGQDFIDFLGYNPLLPTIELRLNANYTDLASIDDFQRNILRYHMVKDIRFQKDLVSLVNENVSRIILVLGIISILVLLLSIILINNTMKLLIYSKRFVINSMQLVGAKSSFIRAPFLWKSLTQGFIASLISISILASGLYYASITSPFLVELKDSPSWLMVFSLMLVVSLFFTFVSAYVSVNRYIKMRNTDRIYR